MLQEMIQHNVFSPIDPSGSLFINDTERMKPFFHTPSIDDDPDFQPPYSTSELMEIMGCVFALSLPLEIPLGHSLHPLFIEMLFSNDPESIIDDLPTAARHLFTPHVASLSHIQHLIDCSDFDSILSMDLDFSFFEFDPQSNSFIVSPLIDNNNNNNNNNKEEEEEGKGQEESGIQYKTVTRENAQRFVDLSFKKLVGSSKSRFENVKSFVSGFQRIFFPSQSCLLFLSPKSFHDFHLGSPRVTVDNFKSVLGVTYEEVDFLSFVDSQPADSPIKTIVSNDPKRRILREWFEECLERLTDDEISNLFFVVTSRKIFPSHGLCEKIEISFSPISVPHVYTCYTSISFPFYPSLDALLEGVHMVISHHDSHGFFAN